MFLVGDYVPKDRRVELPAEFTGALVLGNLEGPICDDALTQSNKVGVCLHSNSTGIDGLRGLKGCAFSLANNHMMDFAAKGLNQTISNLNSNNIQWAGAGVNAAAARRPMVLEDAGKHIAVFCCCERQFGVATCDAVGVCEKGPWLFEAVRNVKRVEDVEIECSNGSVVLNHDIDFVIVSCHAASEYSPWVSPELCEFYHALIDAGVDVIHGHHSHVPQGFEVYKGRPIFYGLGNFIIKPQDWGVGNRNSLWSGVVKLDLRDGVRWEVFPYQVFGDEVVSIRKLEGKLLSECMYYYDCCNHQFQSPASLMGCWQESCVRLFHGLYGQVLRMPSVMSDRLSVKDRLRKLFFAVGDIVRAFLGREVMTAKSVYYAKVYYNNFNCESHRNVVSTVLGLFSSVEQDCRSKKIKLMADDIM